MDLGWSILSAFLIIEILLVTLLCLPMPSNEIRGFINNWVASLWEFKPVVYTALGLLLLDIIYFAYVFQSLANPLYDLGFWSHDMGVSCEYKQDLYLAERNAYITGANLFLFFVLRRLVDIQGKLHVARGQVKQLGGGGGGANLIEGKKSAGAIEAKKNE